MSSTATLARRFRSQRTDRIRLEGNEVFSKVELSIEGPTIIEVAFEAVRPDTAEGLGVYAPGTALSVIATDTHLESPGWPEADQLSLVMPPESIVQLRCESPRRMPLTIWNTWVHEGTEHAWTGNSGIMVEDLDAPDGAAGRVRLWCSDGLGPPSFDDLVVAVTHGLE